MATQGQRKRPGGVKKGAKGSGGRGLAELAAGLRGISELAGNRALVSMLARSKGKGAVGVEEADEDAKAPEEQEELLAKLRLLLDGSHDIAGEAQSKENPDKAMALVREHVLRLLAVLHAALDGAKGYGGELEEEFEKLARGGAQGAGQHRLEAMLELLQTMNAHGEKLHQELAAKLPSSHDSEPKPLEVPAALVSKLKRELREIQERLAADRAAKPSEQKKPAGTAGLLDSLELPTKKKLGR
jgi:hypothetical protein